MDVENGICWSEIGSGFGDPGGTYPYREFRGVKPPPGFKAVRMVFVSDISKGNPYNQQANSIRNILIQYG